MQYTSIEQNDNKVLNIILSCFHGYKTHKVVNSLFLRVKFSVFHFSSSFLVPGQNQSIFSFGSVLFDMLLKLVLSRKCPILFRNPKVS